MIDTEQKLYRTTYDQHPRAPKPHGYSGGIIDVYARVVRRLVERFDCVPDRLSTEQLWTGHFAELINSHTWGMVRVDRNGLQPSWHHFNIPWKFLLSCRSPQTLCLSGTSSFRNG